MTHKHRSNRFLRLLVPLLFILVAGAVVYGLHHILNVNPQKSGADGSADAANTSDTVKPIIVPEKDDTFEALTSPEHVASIPVGKAPMPDIEPKGGGNAEAGQAPVDGGILALQTLEKFLAMETLEERLPHLESKLNEAELAGSVLAGRLPEVLKTTVDVRETNSIEQVVDYYYHVDFADGAGGENLQTMLVRTRGEGDPKVVVDPFLDLFGGRFARYAEKPTEDAGTFQVIISAGAFCYDDVPSPDKKYTLKILAREDAREIAKAYFGKRSKIGDMLEDETSGLAYGQAKACTVFMRWNKDEDPQKPFLEALDIKALNWNP